MAKDDGFLDLMGRLDDGDPGAASEVFGRFSRRLIVLAGRQFGARTSHRADPEGVVQSVFRSFFGRYQRGEFELADWERLWALLTVITLRKCRRRREYLRAGRRDFEREANGPSASRSGGGWEVPDREPTPLEAAMLAETIEQLLSGLEGPDLDVVLLSLQDYTAREIAARLGCSERTVRRVRERAKYRLCRMQAAEVEAS